MIGTILTGLFFTAPEVSADVKETGGHCVEKMAHIREMFVKPLKAIDKATPDKSAMRSQAFKVQGLARALEPRDALFEKISDEAKALEDALGDNSLHGELAEAAKAAGFEKGFIRFLNEKINKADAELDDFLKDEKWIGANPSRATRLGAEVFGFSFKSASKEQGKFLKAMKKEFKKLRKDAKKLEDLIEAETYDYEALEEGLHEFRRLLRWAAIMIQASAPYFHIEPHTGPTTADDARLIRDYSESPFTQLSPQAPHTVGIPQVDFYRLTYLIEALGELKNRGEAEYYLTKRWRKYSEEVLGQKISKSEARAFVRKKLGPSSADGIEKATQALYEYYRQHDTVKNIVAALDL